MTDTPIIDAAAAKGPEEVLRVARTLELNQARILHYCEEPVRESNVMIKPHWVAVPRIKEIIGDVEVVPPSEELVTLRQKFDRANLLLCAKLDMNTVPVISDAKFHDRYGFHKYEWNQVAMSYVTDGTDNPRKPYDNEDVANYLIGKLTAEFGSRRNQQVTDELLAEIRGRIASLLIQRGLEEFPEIEVRRTRLDTVEVRAPGVWGMRLELIF